MNRYVFSGITYCFSREVHFHKIIYFQRFLIPLPLFPLLILSAKKLQKNIFKKNSRKTFSRKKFYRETHRNHQQVQNKEQTVKSLPDKIKRRTLQSSQSLFLYFILKLLQFSRTLSKGFFAGPNRGSLQLLTGCSYQKVSSNDREADKTFGLNEKIGHIRKKQYILNLAFKVIWNN